jgi:hypothetical protein
MTELNIRFRRASPEMDEVRAQALILARACRAISIGHAPAAQADPISLSDLLALAALWEEWLGPHASTPDGLAAASLALESALDGVSPTLPCVENTPDSGLATAEMLLEWLISAPPHKCRAVRNKTMRLAEYLDQRGQTLTSFAAEIGEKITTVHGWVSGRRRPNVGAVATIERVTKGKVRAADFLDDSRGPGRENEPAAA